MTTKKPMDLLPKLRTKTHTKHSNKKSTVKLTGKVYQVNNDLLKDWQYWNQPLPEDFHPGRRIRGEDHSKRSQENIIGNDHGRSNKSTKISTELPTELPAQMQSFIMLTERLPILILNHITEKPLQVNTNCR
jgi:hypothetical protein